MTSERDVRHTVTFAFLCFGILYLMIGIESWEDARSLATRATTAAVIARFVYVRWIWKWLPMAIHGVPVLEGTWTGTFQSTGNERTPAENRNGTLKVFIRQPSISKIKILRESSESRSQSFAENLSIDDDGTVRCLYTYLSEPNALVKGRSPISYGTAKLTTTQENLSQLQGDYWTDQKTTGVLTLTKV